MSTDHSHTAILPEPTNGRQSSDPLLVLEHDHSIVLGRVRELDDAARSIREKGFTAGAFESVARTAVFLDDFFRNHEALEEKHLFPAVVQTDPAQAKALREEHRSMRTLFAGLLALVREIEGGRIHGSSVGDILRTSGAIVALVRRHVIHEDDIIYPLVRKKFYAADIALPGHSVPASGHS